MSITRVKWGQYGYDSSPLEKHRTRQSCLSEFLDDDKLQVSHHAHNLGNMLLPPNDPGHIKRTVDSIWLTLGNVCGCVSLARKKTHLIRFYQLGAPSGMYSRKM